MRLLFIPLLLVAGAVVADTTADLVGLEQRLTDALQRSDVDAVAALWADDLVWIGLSGKQSSKAEQLAGMKAQAAAPGSAPAVVGVVNKDVKVRVYGESAVVTVLSSWTIRTAEGDAPRTISRRTCGTSAEGSGDSSRRTSQSRALELPSLTTNRRDQPSARERGEPRCKRHSAEPLERHRSPGVSSRAPRAMRARSRARARSRDRVRSRET